MSNSTLQPIKVYGKGGPNPPKVELMVKELGLPYEIVPIGFADVKKPEYLAINPNGRMPAIQDPNTNLTLWESGAIIEYLVEKYDKEYKLSFAPGTPEYYHAKQWLFFQVSGQGPYYGQVSWFKRFHQEKLPSAIERYVKEAQRVTGVLEGHLAKQKVEGEDGPWIVGGKFSYVDLAWSVYQHLIGLFMEGEDGYNPDDYPNMNKWLANLNARPVFKEVFGNLGH